MTVLAEYPFRCCLWTTKLPVIRRRWRHCAAAGTDIFDAAKPPAEFQQMPEKWWVMNHSGAARSYADERKKGDWIFVTDLQEIGAEGREGGGFNFSSALLSAGQPPFYPKMLRAQICPQQLQSLTGQSAPKLTVEYVADYVKKGFIPSETGALDSALNLRGRDRISCG